MPAQTVIQTRRDTAANWTSTNPTLAAGEIGFETDTSKFKIGTGLTAWTSLAYQNASGPTGPTGPTGSYTVSATTPVSPSANNVWFNSDDGRTYIYYNDGNTTQWVEFGNANVGSTVSSLVNPTITGTVIEDVFTITDGAAFEIDPANGSIQLITLGADRTPKATNFLEGQSITLMVDDGTARTITWTDSTFGTSGVSWQSGGGTAPVLATTGYTTIVLWKVGTQVYGAKVG